MKNTNENGSKRVLILVHPTANVSGYLRPAKSFQTDQDALDYALEGDAFIYVFEDGTTYPTTMGPKSGVDWGSCIAEAYLYSDLVPEKSDILDMCFHEDKEASIAFVNSLVDYVIECRTEKEAGL
ncbi:TPA: hypothetical protein ACVOYR_001475 [Vibrio alginolyticus]|uniref:hypothetical protein n=1 Tax=Vibrio alginolyticus TaxID=663 RepID=UPI00215ECEBD|nr:hypothetical protein [Vibrio alginolyticus]MCS0223029.1 hypothetical protein [Vibrio alginolyticus]